MNVQRSKKTPDAETRNHTTYQGQNEQISGTSDQTFCLSSAGKKCNFQRCRKRCQTLPKTSKGLWCSHTQNTNENQVILGKNIQCHV